MVKKLILISSGILFLLIVFLTLISFIRTKSVRTDTNRYLSPTPIDIRQNYQQNSYQNKSDSSIQNQYLVQENSIPSEQQIITLETLKQTSVYETSDFSVQYSKKLNKFVVTEKTTRAKEAFAVWLKNKGLSNLVNNTNIFVFSKKSIEVLEEDPLEISRAPNEGLNSMISLMKILLTFPKINPKDISFVPTITQPTPTTSQKSSVPPVGSGGFTYYSQCNGAYDNYPLPGGCTVCKAGCGPTTVSMIVASYIDKSITPLSIVDIYSKNGYYLGCDGSGYMEARSVISRFGVKTTDFLQFGGSSVSSVTKEMRNYIKAGWTLFVLANYCEGGCGHFFWITDVDESGNVWAYDPYYGKLRGPPINENQYSPFPRYRIAFGVKKP